MNEHQLVRCSYDRHAESILAIFNEAIATSTALFDYQARTANSMRGWFDAKAAGGYPVLGIESHDGRLLAFGSYGPFRGWPAYKYTVEHSVYVHQHHRGLHLGASVVRALIAEATRQDLHAMIGGVESTNAASIALHAKLGFKHVGTLPQVGFKFSRWLDLAFYQLLLDTPSNPMDG